MPEEKLFLSEFSPASDASLNKKKMILRAEEIEFSISGYGLQFDHSPINLWGDTNIRCYAGEDLEAITENQLAEIASCYQDVFNESWNENWTIESAKNEVVRSFQCSDKRFPLGCLLYKKNTIIGFSWCAILDVDHLNCERDMPYFLSEKKKKEGFGVAKYWLEKISGTEKVLFIRELGVIKSMRTGNMAPILLYPLLTRAKKLGIKTVLFTTSAKAKTFRWGLGVRWVPIHFFVEQDMVIMQGNIAESLEIADNLFFDKNDKHSYKNIFENIQLYLGKK